MTRDFADRQSGNHGSAICSAIARVLCMLGLATTLAACFDGYPQSEVPVLSPVTMSQKQRVAAMNTVGKLHYLDERWRYKLNDACELKVSTGSWFSVNHSDWVPLASTQIVKNFDKSDKTHDVLLHPVASTAPGVTPVPLVAGAKWEDAVQLMSLAQYMQRDCVQRG
jgi:hypothetical protein